jgi:hypothetical protein
MGYTFLLCPRWLLLYPMVVMMYGLCCCGRLCFGLVGIVVGCCVVVLSFCIPPWVDSRGCRVWSSCGVVTSICVCILKSLWVFSPGPCR